MTGADIDCMTIMALRWSWLDGELTGSDEEAYEQHLLLCPACLAFTGNGRAAMRALAAAGRHRTVPRDVVDRLTAGGAA